MLQGRKQEARFDSSSETTTSFDKHKHPSALTSSRTKLPAFILVYITVGITSVTQFKGIVCVFMKQA